MISYQQTVADRNQSPQIVKFIDLVVEMETVLFKLNNNDDGDYR